MKTFVFEKVVLIRPYVFALIGFFVIAPIVIAIITFLTASLPGMIGAVIVGLIVMFVILKGLSKTVEISFDATHINFTYNGKTTQYLKNDLKGFYSFNYFHTSNCTISMRFDFSDGKKIDISDYQGNAAKFNAEKHQMLKDFLNAAESELGFTDVSISKARSLGKIGNVWFARQLKTI